MDNTMATIVAAASSSPVTYDDSTTNEWDRLRRLARKLEGDLDVRLSSFAKIGGFSDKKSISSSNNKQWNTLEMEIETLLVHLTEVNDKMSQLALATTTVRSTAAVMQRVARHQEILHELTREFNRTKRNLQSVKEHAELLTSVRNDINEHKSSSNVKPERKLLRERAAIHGSITQIDEVIDQAETTRSALTTQRSAFGEIRGKLRHLNDKFPSIRGTLGAIKRKKLKDNIILSAVVAICTLFLVAYWFAK